jgi:hypothetical protein
MWQSGTIMDYVEKFLSLLAHYDPLSSKQQVQLFTFGQQTMGIHALVHYLASQASNATRVHLY